MTQSSRSKANSWPYPRHMNFEEKLKASNQKWFVDRGLAVNQRMPYLLAHWEDWPKNIILPEVARYIQDERSRREVIQKGFPLHKYVHHGLSSQAMLFNLIGPLIVKQDYAPIQKAFEINGITWPAGEVTTCLEYEDRAIFNEDSGQPTSIDLVIQGSDQSPALFIESKLVEREFGSCSVFNNGDCDGRNPMDNFNLCYLHWIGRQYWNKLGKYRFTEGLLGQEYLCPLAVHYQFFREVLFALSLDGTFVLLYDDRNPTFFCQSGDTVRGLMPLLLQFVPDEYHERVKSVSIQSIVAAIKESGRHPWISEFESKYDLA